MLQIKKRREKKRKNLTEDANKGTEQENTVLWRKRKGKGNTENITIKKADESGTEKKRTRRANNNVVCGGKSVRMIKTMDAPFGAMQRCCAMRCGSNGILAGIVTRSVGLRNNKMCLMARQLYLSNLRVHFDCCRLCLRFRCVLSWMWVCFVHGYTVQMRICGFIANKQ